MASLHIKREDLITVLASFGAELPKNTKIPLEELQKLLTRALNYSQQIDELFKPSSKLNLASCPNWTGNESLTTAMHSINMEEVVLGSAPMSRVKQGPHSPKENIFTELRQTTMGLGYAMDLGKNRVYFTGENHDWLIELRIVSVQKVNDKTPLFIINYKHEEMTGRDALEKIQVGYTPVVISDLERWVLLALWAQNGERLDATQRARARAGYQVSFVLPLGSIGMKELGSLTHNPGCAVCGKKYQNRCMECQTAVYCSKACAKEDWPNHKTQCTSLKNATWHRVTFSDPPGPVRSIINRRDQLNGISSRAMEGASEPEAGPAFGKVFLAKFQIPMGGRGGDILIYDRQRTFTNLWKSFSNPAAYHLALREASKAPMPKIYRWTRRVTDKEYEICLDRAPPQDPVW